jgi:anti-anti-sigma factor
MDRLAPPLQDGAGDWGRVALRIQRCDSPRELMVGGELDVATAPELKRILGTMSSAGDITLDLTFLRFADEAGLQLLLSTAERLDGSLVLTAPPDTLLRLLGLLTRPAPPNLVIKGEGENAATTRRPGSGRP